jgi:hypothetical protein
MQSTVNFCYWLRGCLDLQIFPEELDKYQMQIISDKLNKVLEEIGKDSSENKPTQYTPPLKADTRLELFRRFTS